MNLQKVDAYELISDFGFDDIPDEDVEEIINMGCEAYNYYFTYDGFEDIISRIPENPSVLYAIDEYDWDEYSFDEIEGIIDKGMLCNEYYLNYSVLDDVLSNYESNEEKIYEYEAQIEELQNKVDDYNHTITLLFAIAFIAIVIAVFSGSKKEK